METKKQTERPGIVSIKGEMVGLYWRLDGMLCKKVKGSKHLLRKLNAWGIQERVIETVQKLGCRIITLYDTEARRAHQCTMERMLEDGLVYDFGRGPQRFLNVTLFDDVPVDRFRFRLPSAER